MATPRLYHRYPGQTSSQPCFLDVDMHDGTVAAGWDPEIGNTIPRRVYDGRVRRFRIPCLTDEATARLEEAVRRELARMLMSTGDEIDKVIEMLIEEESGEDSLAKVWDARDWYAVDNDPAGQLGITASTTDAQIMEIAAREEAEASDKYDNIDVLYGTLGYLRDLRQQLQDAEEK